MGIEAEASQPAAPGRRGPVARGHYVAAVGAIGLIVSLFLPWYSLNLPPGAREALDAETRRLPEGIRELGRSFVEEVLGGVGGTAWEVFSSVDIVLLACAVLVLVMTLFVVITGGGSTVLRPTSAGRAIGLLGTGAAGLIVVKMLDQPGPNVLLEVDYGAYVALGAAAVIAFGGWSAGESAQRTV
jgi:hypothetical protein